MTMMMTRTRMSRRHRVIRPETLQNPEQGLELTDRDVRTFSDPQTLADRIAVARRLSPSMNDGCRDCWSHGRNAAVAAITGDEEGLEDRIVQAHLLEPKGSELHWRASWERGRDAALEVIEGA
jgi:hypothetical protein